MKKLRVLVDADDVLWSLGDAWCAWLNKEHGTNVKWEDVTDWNICDFFPSLTPDEIFAPTVKEEFWKTVRVKDGAAEYVRKLKDDGFKVFICTASDYNAIKFKFDCLIKKYFNYILWSDVIVTQHKGMVLGDVLIDDGIHNFDGFQGEKIIMTAPHNQYYDAEHNGMKRANSWEEVYRLIHKIASENI